MINKFTINNRLAQAYACLPQSKLKALNKTLADKNKISPEIQKEVDEIDIIFQDILCAEQSKQPALIYALFDKYKHEAILEAFKNNFSLLCDAVKCAPVKNTKIVNIAIFSSTLQHGGSERVVCLLSDIFINIGYNVTLCTQSEKNDGEYAYNATKIKRVILPRSKHKRWQAVQKICIDNSIDVCIMNDHYHEFTLFDILAARLTGTKIIAIEHSMFFYLLHRKQYGTFNLRHYAYKAVNVLVCLSTVNELWWKSAGYKNTVYLPNPLTFTAQEKIRSVGDSKQILFVGRATVSKGIVELLYVFRKVLDAEPQATLVICGRFSDDYEENLFYKIVNQLNLTRNVFVQGHVKNIEHFYAGSAVHVMPSHVEGFPMVLMEAKAHGLPSVVFSMPYLAVGTVEHGTIMVGKNDIDGMATEILKLLNIHKYWQTMSDKAFNSVFMYSNDTVTKKWENIFLRLNDNKAIVENNIEQKIAQNLLSMAMKEIIYAFQCGAAEK